MDHDEGQVQRDEGSATRFPGTVFDLVAIGASAGGISALRRVLSGLPGDFPAACVVVQHLGPTHRSMVAEILDRATPLEVRQAQDGDTLRPATVYVAPPDQHLLVAPPGRVVLSHAKQVRFLRPSADLLFESVANTYKSRAIAVVLSGTGGDGSDGVRAIKTMGGTVIVQERSTAEFTGMPDAAIATEVVDLIVPLEGISRVLAELVAP
jgi:two-component system chemotaxis response regulator CheB